MINHGYHNHKKNSSYFWNSELSIRFVDQFFITNENHALLKGYFKQRKVRDDLVQALAEQFPELLISSIKRNKAFLKKNHFDSFKRVLENHSNEKLQSFFKEIFFLRTLYQQIEEMEDQFGVILDRLTITELLIHFSLYYEKERLRLGLNEHIFVGVEANLIGVFNRILNKKVEISKNKLKSERISMESFLSNLAKIIDQKISEKYEGFLIEEVIKVYDQVDIFEHLLNLYSYENWQLELTSDDKGKLFPESEEKFKQWIKVGAKYPEWASWNYTSIHESESAKQVSELDINLDNKCAYLNTLANFKQYIETLLPEEITFDKNKSFESFVYCIVLNYLSQYCNSRYLYETLKYEIDESNYMEFILQFITQSMFKHQGAGANYDSVRKRSNIR